MATEEKVFVKEMNAAVRSTYDQCAAICAAQGAEMGMKLSEAILTEKAKAFTDNPART